MSTAKFNTLQNAAGSVSVPVDTVVNGSAKAWVNFNGSGTVAIRASFNVSSITDGGTGTYTVNFTTAMADANYAAAINSDNFGVAISIAQSSVLRGNTTTGAAIATVSAPSTPADASQINVAIFR